LFLSARHDVSIPHGEKTVEVVLHWIELANMTRPQFLTVSFLAVGIMTGSVITAHLRDVARAESGAISFNQNYLEAIREEASDLTNPVPVFAYVFSHLPPTVRVYPTENYYYFTFYNGGQNIWGNIRLDAEDRDQGLVSFAYFGAHGQPQQPEDLDFSGSHKMLGPADGVRLVKEDTLRYKMTYGTKSVVFLLNDIPQTLPAGMPLTEAERFMARIFDESGFQLALVFDDEHQQFRFILDETAPLPDVLQRAEDDLFIGRLSGFVFWQDQPQRKVLIGVNGSNIRRNNYFDGPFDQLADNFVTDNTLKDAMEAAYPYVRGRINARGTFVNEAGERLNTRLALTPYATYYSLAELKSFLEFCRRGKEPAETLACLTRDYKQDVPERKAENEELKEASEPPPGP
jgi:hypothetical protein